MENGELMNKSKDLVHSLYNSLSKSKENNFDDIKEVLLKVYTKLDLCDEKNICIIIIILIFYLLIIYLSILYLTISYEFL